MNHAAIYSRISCGGLDEGSSLDFQTVESVNAAEVGG